MNRLYTIFLCLWMLLGITACAQQHDSLHHAKEKQDLKADPFNENKKKPQTHPQAGKIEELSDDVFIEEESVLNLQQKEVFFSVELLGDVPEPTKIEDSNMGFSPDVTVAEGGGKMPPVRQVRVKLSIQNRQSQPVWYLLPAQGEVALQADGNFFAAVPQTAFMGREYLGLLNEDSTQQGRLVECYFKGNYQHSFKAFYVPANSSITLRNYTLEVWGELKEIELWGVKSLLVNGKKPLQDWLPFSALSDRGNLKIACPAEGSCVCKEIADPAKICAEAVDFMQAKDFKKYHITLP